jgi:hypothetical protein
MSGPHPDPAELLTEAEAAWSGELIDPPEHLVETRKALHRVAEDVLKEAREKATGNEIALRWYPGGFGTPPIPEGGESRIIRVESLTLLDVRDSGESSRTPLTSLRAAAGTLGDLLDASELSDDPLGIDQAAADFLGLWFAFATLAIAELQTGANASLDPGLVQLWPEHFDIATELGSEADGKRAAFGASPGDEEHDEPYVYVAPWIEQPEAEVWNSTAFKGAEMPYAELRAADDPRAAVATFFARAVRALG